MIKIVIHNNNKFCFSGDYMRKIFLILLLMCCFITFNSCDSVLNSPTQDALGTTSPTDVTDPTESVVPNLQSPLYAVSVPSTTHTVISSDASVIFEYSYQSMSLVHDNPDSADKIILDFLNRVDKTHRAAEDVSAQAEANHTNSANWIPYFYNVTYSPTRIDKGVLSLFGTIISFNGSAHPTYSCIAANYNMLSGDVLTLGSILYHIDSLPLLHELVVDEVSKIVDEKYIRDDYKSVIQQRFLKNESFDEDWYFSANGLCFYFAPYDIAPYSSGIISVEIPYEKLTGIIADDFFPPEKNPGNGSLQQIAFEDAALDQFTQIAELVLEKESKKQFIYTEAPIIDVSIRYTDAMTGSSYTIFAASGLSTGEAIMLECGDEILGRLQISYTTETGAKTLSITEISSASD